MLEIYRSSGIQSESFRQMYSIVIRESSGELPGWLRWVLRGVYVLTSVYSEISDHDG
jgi:hypothetical protein